jgi:hypothetical protein
MKVEKTEAQRTLPDFEKFFETMKSNKKKVILIVPRFAITRGW